MTVCLLPHARLTFLKTPFLWVTISTFKSGWKERKGRGTCTVYLSSWGGVGGGVKERPGSQLSLIPAPEPASCTSHPRLSPSSAAILTSQHLACGITLSSQALPHIFLFLLLLSLHLLMVFTINPSLVLLACSKQMERRLHLPLASLSLSSLRHPSCEHPRASAHTPTMSVFLPNLSFPFPLSYVTRVFQFCVLALY